MATPNSTQSLRERMLRAERTPGFSRERFLLAELRQGQDLQSRPSMPLVEAGVAIEQAARALLAELGLSNGQEDAVEVDAANGAAVTRTSFGYSADAS